MPPKNAKEGGRGRGRGIGAGGSGTVPKAHTVIELLGQAGDPSASNLGITVGDLAQLLHEEDCQPGSVEVRHRQEASAEQPLLVRAVFSSPEHAAAVVLSMNQDFADMGAPIRARLLKPAPSGVAPSPAGPPTTGAPAAGKSKMHHAEGPPDGSGPAAGGKGAEGAVPMPYKGHIDPVGAAGPTGGADPNGKGKGQPKGQPKGKGKGKGKKGMVDEGADMQPRDSPPQRQESPGPAPRDSPREPCELPPCIKRGPQRATDKRFREYERCVHAIMVDMLRRGRCVRFQDVVMEFLQRQSKGGPTGVLPRLQDLCPSVHEPYALMGLWRLAKRQNEFEVMVNCYLCLRNFGSLSDLQDFIIGWYNRPETPEPLRRELGEIRCFEDLGLGPLCAQPAVLDCFPGAAGLPSPPAVPRRKVVELFVDFFQSRSRKREDLNLTHFVKHLEKHEGRTADEMCLWLHKLDTQYGFMVPLLAQLNRENRCDVERHIRSVVRGRLQQDMDMAEDEWRQSEAEYGRLIKSEQVKQMREWLTKQFARDALRPGPASRVAQHIRNAMYMAAGSNRLDETTVAAITTVFVDYLRFTNGAGVCPQCSGRGPAYCEVCWNAYRKEAGPQEPEEDPIIAAAHRVQGGASAMSNRELRECAEILGVTILRGDEKSEIQGLLRARAQEVLQERGPASEPTPEPDPGHELPACGSDLPRATSSGGPAIRVQRRDLIEMMRGEPLQTALVVDSSLAVLRHPGAAAGLRLAALEHEICNALGLRRFADLRFGSFLQFLAELGYSEEQSDQSAYIELLQSVSADPCGAASGPREPEELCEVMLDFLREKARIPSFGVLGRMEAACVERFGAASWSAICPSASFVSFIGKNIRMFLDKGYNFLIGGRTDAEDAAAAMEREADKSLVLRFLQSAIDLLGRDAAALADLTCRQFGALRWADLGVGGLGALCSEAPRPQFDGALRWAVLLSRPSGGDAQEEGGGDAEGDSDGQEKPEGRAGGGVAEALSPAVLDGAREAAGREERAIISRIAKVCRARPGCNVGDAMLWEELWEAEHGPLARFCERHDKELEELGAVLLFSRETHRPLPPTSNGVDDAVSVFAAEASASLDKVRAACEGRDWGRAGLLLWSLASRSELGPLVRHAVSDALGGVWSPQHSQDEELALAVADMLLAIPCGAVASIWSTVLGEALFKVTPEWESRTAHYAALHPEAAALARRAMRCGLQQWANAAAACCGEPPLRRRYGPAPTEPAHGSLPQVVRAVPDLAPVRAPSPPPAGEPAVAAPSAPAADDEQEPQKGAASAAGPTETSAAQRDVVEHIRKLAGAGAHERYEKMLELGGEAAALADEQRETSEWRDQGYGNALDRLAVELYDSKIHFIFELVQNADDNDYHPDVLAREGGPAVHVTLHRGGVDVLNNEAGFRERNVRALCTVGSSTKKNDASRIGRKGIGFKSVFAVTDRPTIVSNGFHFYFDRNAGKLGMIIPHWLDEDEMRRCIQPRVGELLPCAGAVAPAPGQWTTMVHLPFSTAGDDAQLQRCSKELDQIDGRLLLFLNKLRTFSMCNDVTGKVVTYSRCSSEQGTVIIRTQEQQQQQHEGAAAQVVDKVEEFLVVSSRVQVPDLVKRAAVESNKNHQDKSETVLQVAFLLPTPDKRGAAHATRVPHFPVMAYLPTQHVIFPFVLQADWNLTSSRASVLRDDAWNQWVLGDLCPELIVSALRTLMSHAQGEAADGLQLPRDYLLAVTPLPDSTDSNRQWVAVAREVLLQLRDVACIPCSDGSWATPTRSVLPRSQQARAFLELLGPQTLQDCCGLRLADSSVLAHEQVAKALGVLDLEPRMLVDILTALDGAGRLAEQSLDWMAKFFPVLYEALAHHSDPGLGQSLRKLRILPVVGGRRVAADDGRVFFPPQSGPVTAKYAFERSMLYLDPELLKLVHHNDLAAVRMMLMRQLQVSPTSPDLVLSYIRQNALPRFFTPAADPSEVSSVLLWIADNEKELSGKDAGKGVQAVLAELPLVCRADGPAPDGFLEGMGSAVCRLDASGLVLARPRQAPVHLGPDLGGADPRRFDTPGAAVQWLLVDGAHYLSTAGSRRSGAPFEALQSFLVTSCGVSPTAAVFLREKGDQVAGGEWAAMAQPPRSFKSIWTLDDWRAPSADAVLRCLLPAGPEGGEQAAVPRERARALMILAAELARGGAPGVLRAECCSYLPVRDAAVVPTERDRAQWPEAPSSAGLLLRERPWLLDQAGVPRRPAELFLPTPEVRALLRDKVPYLHRGYDEAVSLLAERLGAVARPTVTQVARLLQRWAGEKDFRSHAEHMAAVYAFLSADGEEAAAAREALRGTACIWRPQRGERSEGRAMTTGVWHDPSDCYWFAGFDRMRERAHKAKHCFLEAYYGHLSKAEQDRVCTLFRFLGVTDRAPPAVVVRVLAEAAASRQRSVRDRNFILQELLWLRHLCTARSGEGVQSTDQVVVYHEDLTEDEFQDGLRALWSSPVWPTHDDNFVSPAAVRLLIDDVHQSDEEITMPAGTYLLGGGAFDSRRFALDPQFAALLRHTAQAMGRDPESCHLSSNCESRLDTRPAHMGPQARLRIAAAWLVLLDFTERQLRALAPGLDVGELLRRSVAHRHFRLVPGERLRRTVLLTAAAGSDGEAQQEHAEISASDLTAVYDPRDRKLHVLVEGLGREPLQRAALAAAHELVRHLLQLAPHRVHEQDIRPHAEWAARQAAGHLSRDLSDGDARPTVLADACNALARFAESNRQDPSLTLRMDLNAPGKWIDAPEPAIALAKGWEVQAAPGCSSEEGGASHGAAAKLTGWARWRLVRAAFQMHVDCDPHSSQGVRDELVSAAMATGLAADGADAIIWCERPQAVLLDKRAGEQAAKWAVGAVWRHGSKAGDLDRVDPGLVRSSADGVEAEDDVAALCGAYRAALMREPVGLEAAAAAERAEDWARREVAQAGQHTLRPLSTKRSVSGTELLAALAAAWGNLQRAVRAIAPDAAGRYVAPSVLPEAIRRLCSDQREEAARKEKAERPPRARREEESLHQKPHSGAHAGPGGARGGDADDAVRRMARKEAAANRAGVPLDTGTAPQPAEDDEEGSQRSPSPPPSPGPRSPSPPPSSAEPSDVTEDQDAPEPLRYEDASVEALVQLARGRRLLPPEEPEGGWVKEDVVAALYSGAMLDRDPLFGGGQGGAYSVHFGPDGSGGFAEMGAPMRFALPGGPIAVGGMGRRVGGEYVGPAGEEDPVGTIGEEIALEWVKKQHPGEPVVWVNKDKEIATPFDIVLGISEEELRGKEGLSLSAVVDLAAARDGGRKVVLYEVKASRGAAKEGWEMSVGELDCARAAGPGYCVVQVLGVGHGASEVTVRPFLNPYGLLRSGGLCLTVVVAKQQQRRQRGPDAAAAEGAAGDV